MIPTWKKWAHLVDVPFLEIADLLEEKDQAIVSCCAQLKTGTELLMAASEATRAADAELAKMVDLLVALEELLACRTSGSFGSDGAQGWNLAEAAVAKARGGA